tara:strand:+ start:587 stop:1291 length:705 start_codon:yes stop_codon:yes gene_type:complete
MIGAISPALPLNGWRVADGLGQMEHLVDPARQAPRRVALQDLKRFVDILGLARFGLKVDQLGAILFDLIFAERFANDILQLGYAFEPFDHAFPFWADRPVFNQVKQLGLRRERSARLDMESVAESPEGFTERSDILAQRFATGQAYPFTGMDPDLVDDLLQAHLGKRIELGVAEEASKIALCEPDEDSWLTDAGSFPRDRVEDLVDLENLAVVPDGSAMLGCVRDAIYITHIVR